MKTQWMALLVATGFAAGCASQISDAPNERTSHPEPADAVYAVALTAAAPRALPKCTSSLAGTVAYVSSPSSLWRCSGGCWTEIRCNTEQAGNVAYASATQTLLECEAQQWTAIALAIGITLIPLVPYGV